MYDYLYGRYFSVSVAVNIKGPKKNVFCYHVYITRRSNVINFIFLSFWKKDPLLKKKLNEHNPSLVPWQGGIAHQDHNQQNPFTNNLPY